MWKALKPIHWQEYTITHNLLDIRLQVFHTMWQNYLNREQSLIISNVMFFVPYIIASSGADGFVSIPNVHYKMNIYFSMY